MADPTAGNGTYTGLGQNLGNDIDEVTKFITEKLDDIIVQEAKTSGMTADPAFVQATSVAGTVKLATMLTTGLGNYDKIEGYPVGGVQLSWESYQLAYDRAISATIDRRDTQTSGGLATAAAALAETMRQEVVPEIDATRMAKLYSALYAQNSANSNVVAEAAPTAANIVSKIIDGIDAVANVTGNEEGMTIYVNGLMRSALDKSSEVTKNWDVQNGGKDVNMAIRSIHGNRLVFVPPKRMKTTITLNNGFTNALSDDTDKTSIDRTKYGYTPGAKDIYFAITTPGVANAVTAINATKVIPAEVNQRYDGDTFMYRIFHDLIVPKNKCPAAYMQVKS